MELKDWLAILTIIVLIATIISSHILVSKQIKINKKSQWIEDLRKELANFIAQCTTITYKSGRKELLNLAKSGAMLVFLTNDTKDEHRELQDEISKMIILVVSCQDEEKIPEFQAKVDSIKRIGKTVLQNEIKRL